MNFRAAGLKPVITLQPAWRRFHIRERCGLGLHLPPLRCSVAALRARRAGRANYHIQTVGGGWFFVWCFLWMSRLQRERAGCWLSSPRGAQQSSAERRWVGGFLINGSTVHHLGCKQKKNIYEDDRDALYLWNGRFDDVKCCSICSGHQMSPNLAHLYCICIHWLLIDHFKRTMYWFFLWNFCNHGGQISPLVLTLTGKITSPVPASFTLETIVLGGFGASFVAINPNCNSPSLCFRNTNVGCLHGSESERNNSHIPVPFVPDGVDSGLACLSLSCQRASRY